MFACHKLAKRFGQDFALRHRPPSPPSVSPASAAGRVTALRCTLARNQSMRARTYAETRSCICTYVHYRVKLSTSVLDHPTADSP